MRNEAQYDAWMGAAKRVEEQDAFACADGHLWVMKKKLSEMLDAEHSEVETYVIEEGRELQRLLLAAHMEIRASREQKLQEVKGADGVRRTTKRASARPLTTLVGKVDVSRTAYQAPDVSGLHPMDAALNLPGEQYSHGVRRLVAEHAAVMSFDDVRHEWVGHTGAKVPKRQVEELSVRAATDFEEFYVQRRADDGQVEEPRFGNLLVLTFDGKGIVMVPEDLRPATKKAAAKATRKLTTRLTSGEKRNRKRMAQVAAVYTVARHVREPKDVLADLDGTTDENARAKRPKVSNKRVWASVASSPKEVILDAFCEADARDPKHQRQWVVLVDGNKDQLSIIEAIRDKHAVRIVIDVIHVLEYLWRAAHALCGEGTHEAEAWVQERLLELLQNRPAGNIATHMRTAARTAKLQGSAAAAVQDAADYLNTYADYMQYGEAIAMGLPIATGVIEGACRHLVKDRMDRGGARWTLSGAEAVLRLRALRVSGDFNAYWEFHLQQEFQRNHAERYADNHPPDPIRRLRSVK